MKTTNYLNTFIEVAPDCPAAQGEIPPLKESGKTAANTQFGMIYDNPYRYTSDDVIFNVYTSKNNVSKREYDAAREKFFSKGQPCLRSSPLTKRYGWGIHSDATGKVALYAVESAGYKKMVKDKSLDHTKGVRSSKK